MPDHSPLRMADIPKDERPRERLARLGPAALTDAELLAIFFRTGMKGMNAIEMGQSIISQFGSLSALSDVTVDQLCNSVKGIGPAKAAELLAVFEMGHRLAREQMRDVRLDEAGRIYEYLGAEMQRLPYESVRVIMLNARFRMIKIEEISRGSLTESVSHPREILRPVIVNAGYAFVLVHNHPSGDPQPSAADIKVTRRLRDAAALLKMEMVDHVIIGQPADHREPYYSFRNAGVLP